MIIQFMDRELFKDREQWYYNLDIGEQMVLSSMVL